MIDQRVSEGKKIKFFDHEAYTTTIPAQLIKKFGCDVIPVHIERNKRYHFNIKFFEPISFDKNKNIMQVTLELNKILEKMILKNPDQWIWTHNVGLSDYCKSALTKVCEIKSVNGRCLKSSPVSAIN